MPTFPELAQRYAQRVTVVTGPARRMLKSSVYHDTARVQLRRTVNEIFREIETLRKENTNDGLTIHEIGELLNLLDDSVGVPGGTFVQIRKSSIAHALHYEAAIAQLYDSIVFE